MKQAERDRMVEQLARMVNKRAATKRRVELLIADCESLFVVNPAGERVLQAIEQLFCVPPTPKVLSRKTGEQAKAAIAKYEGASDVVRFLRAAARGALKVHEAA